MEMTPVQLEQLSAHHRWQCGAKTGRVVAEPKCGKGGGGKGGHAIIEPKYWSRVKDSLGDNALGRIGSRV